jgi:hypothetical protein
VDAVDPVRPRIFARFPPEQRGRVVANFPDAPKRAVVRATFDPEVWTEAQNYLRDQGITAPFLEGPTPAPTSPAEAAKVDPNTLLLQQIASLLSPDNGQNQLKYVTSQVAAGQAYDYQIPPWTRHFLITNSDSTDTGTAGQLYYWYDNPQAGSKVLPQNYATLVAGQSISENSDFTWVTLYANSAATAQGWEIRFSGRPGDKSYKPRLLRAPVAKRQTPGGVKNLRIAPGGAPVLSYVTSLPGATPGGASSSSSGIPGPAVRY